MRPQYSLEALRTFEAAARCGSFALAARDLSLTPSAVSHQLRKLERALGFALFERDGRRVRLSAAGAGLLKSVRPALRSIEETATRLGDPDGSRGPLAIACAAMFANRVLSHRLPQFAESYPLIECTVIAVENAAVLDRSEADVAVLFGTGPWPERWTLPLGPVRYAPVCHPSLLARPQGLPSTPDELMRHVIVHVDDGEEWRRWNRTAGVPRGQRPERQVFTNDVGFALEIAAQGGGITLASDLIVETYLRDGTLVRPFPISIGVDGAWHLVVTPAKLQLPRVQIFIRWLAHVLGQEVPPLA